MFFGGPFENLGSAVLLSLILLVRIDRLHYTNQETGVFQFAYSGLVVPQCLLFLRQIFPSRFGQITYPK